MHIGIDARFYGSLGKGLGRYTEKLIEHLEAIDHDNTYVIFLRRENFSEYVPKNPRFKKAVAQYAWYGFAEQLLFVWRLYGHAFDLVHFPHFNVPLLYRRPFVVTIHDLILVHYPTLRNTTRFISLYWIKFFVYRLVIASAIRRAEQIITVSHFTEADIIKHYPGAKGKITVTYEAADSFCQILSPREEQALFERTGLLMTPVDGQDTRLYHDILKPYFLYVGNAYPHKNLSVLFAVARAFPTYALVLVGKEDFFYRRLKEEVKRAHLQNVIFTGFVTDQELSVLYRCARTYLFPSLYEGFGLPPLEALARGTPVVSSERGSLPEILGNAALYFDPMDEQQLVEVVQKIEHDDVLRNEMRHRGYVQGARFHFRDMAVMTQALYQISDKRNR
ncbi:MAG: glycosyltransferase family 1 protein [Candidatus Moraniibacteriota bacterium]